MSFPRIEVLFLRMVLTLDEDGELSAEIVGDSVADGNALLVVPVGVTVLECPLAADISVFDSASRPLGGVRVAPAVSG